MANMAKTTLDFSQVQKLLFSKRERLDDLTNDLEVMEASFRVSLDNQKTARKRFEGDIEKTRKEIRSLRKSEFEEIHKVHNKSQPIRSKLILAESEKANMINQRTIEMVRSPGTFSFSERINSYSNSFTHSPIPHGRLPL